MFHMQQSSSAFSLSLLTFGSDVDSACSSKPSSPACIACDSTDTSDDACGTPPFPSKAFLARALESTSIASALFSPFLMEKSRSLRVVVRACRQIRSSKLQEANYKKLITGANYKKQIISGKLQYKLVIIRVAGLPSKSSHALAQCELRLCHLACPQQ